MPKDYLQSLLLCHLVIREAYLPDIIDYLTLPHDKFAIELISIADRATARAFVV